MGYDWDKISADLSQIADVEREKPLAEMTSFGIGGPARVVAQPMDRDEIEAVIEYLWRSEVPFFEGFDGVVVGASYDLGEIREIEEGLWRWGAGVSLWRAISRAAERCFGGIEPLAGIPGSVGGAVVMNASAYGVSFFDVVKTVELLLPERGYVRLSAEELAPDYRGAKIPEGALIVAAEAQLVEKEPEKIRSEITDYLSRRAKTQPVNERSAGCVFKNPPGMHAGKLIDECGLKGYSVGGAQVSEVHANFIINRGGARASDVVAIIRHIRRTVFKKFGVQLELEIKTLGFSEEI